MWGVIWTAWTVMALGAESTNPRVLVNVEVSRRPFGMYQVSPVTSGEPMRVLAHVPHAGTGYVVGPFRDAGDVPFRTWTHVSLDRPLYRLFSGRHGVGFDVRVAWPERPPNVPESGLGTNGELLFEGEIWVSLKPSMEGAAHAPLRWGRGFEARGTQATEHLMAVQSTARFEREGRYGPYHWSIRGELHAEVHLWRSGAPSTSEDDAAGRSVVSAKE